MNIYARIAGRLMYPLALLYVGYQSFRNWLRSLNKKDVVLRELPYEGQPILFMALYQGGRLRDDLVLFLEEAKRQGAYVLCVNSLKVNSLAGSEDYIDCYIERYNYGRDFASYQKGFTYINQRGWSDICPRLLMVNDSVFYSVKHNRGFLAEMLSSTVSVLGATENHEVAHHLGSFCIAFSGDVLRNERFRKYWDSYQPTDIRPAVIRRGEMELSETLRRIAGGADNYAALYDITRIIKLLRSDASLLESVHEFTRTSDRVHWARYSLSAVLRRVAKRSLISTYHLFSSPGEEVKLPDGAEFSLEFVLTVEAVARFLSNHLPGYDYDEIYTTIKSEAIAHFAECFVQGSQIHQNNIFLHYIGLPIIKLDGLYRGVLSVGDVERIAMALDPTQADEFRKMMYARPFGASVLYGWKRAAFDRGLL